MFSGNLSAHILQILNDHSLSYEAAAEICDMSTRHFGSIVRREAVPTITMLEKICAGFEVTPNELLLPGVPGNPRLRAMRVQVAREARGFSCYPVCLSCEADGLGAQLFCNGCRRRVEWPSPGEALLLLPDGG